MVVGLWELDKFKTGFSAITVVVVNQFQILIKITNTLTMATTVVTVAVKPIIMRLRVALST